MKGITLALAAAIAGMTTLASTAQQLAVPSSVQLQHAQIIGRLESYAQQDGPAAAAAGKAVAFLKAHYAKEAITGGDRFSAAFDRPFFKEFVVRDGQGRVKELLTEACDEGFLAGVALGQWYPELDDCFLVAVTEKRTKQEIDALATMLLSVSAPVSPAAV